MADNTIASLFATDDAKRQSVLDRCRTAAALSKPWVLPPEGHTEDSRLPENYQSIGSRGITNLEGKILLALYPPETPWFKLQLAAQIRYDPTIPDEDKQEVEQALYLQELTILSVLESASLRGTQRGSRTGFRSRKRAALTQVLVTGDVLEQLTDDYRLKVFRRDQYVTKRDSSGDVLYHIVKEQIDPLSLTDEQLGRADLDRGELQEKPVMDRVTPIYTRTEWQPQSKVWKVEQEVNGHLVNESEEKVSQFFSTPFELAGGEDYGRGFMEQNLGDFRSLDELELRRLDLLALASKALVAIDEGSSTRDRDIAKPSGSVIRCRVKNGVPEDVAMLSFAQVREFSMLTEGIRDKTENLGKAMLLETSAVRDSERTTAFEVSRMTIRELEGALGGLYAPMAENQQVPLLRRAIHQMKRDKIILPLPEEHVDIMALTGLAALSRAAKAQNLMEFTDVVAKIGDTALAKINTDVLVDVMARYKGIDEPGLVKSAEQMQQEQQAAMAAQAQMAAAEKAIDVGGNIIENQMTGGTNAGSGNAAA